MTDTATDFHPRRPSADVAFFMPDLGGGGTEKMMATLANGLSARGYAVDMVLSRAEGIHREGLAPAIRVIELGVSNAYLALPGLIRYLRQDRPRVLVSALDLTNLVALIARWLSGTRPLLAIRIENMLSSLRRDWWKQLLGRWLLAWLYPFADRIIAVSQAVAKDASVYTGIDRSRIQMIYNPVLASNGHAQPTESDLLPWSAASGPPMILGVGRLTAQKDFATLLAAFALVRKARPARLVILGEGEERDRLFALAGELGVERDVSLPGFVRNAGAYMRQCRVFALSSIYEGLPTVLIEALANGCPVVSTDCPGGSREILDDGALGPLVPPRDPKALADAICRLLDSGRRPVDPAWLSQFGVEQVLDETVRVLALPSRST